MSDTKTWYGFCRLGGIGDNLIASSVFPAIKKKYDCLEVIAQKPHSVVFEGNPYIDKLAQLGKDDIPPGEAWQEWFRHRAREYARFENVSHSCEMRLALTRGQTWYWRSDEWRRQFCGKSYIEEVADICGVEYEDCRPGFFPTQAEREEAVAKKAAEAGERCIGWVISGSRFDKIYPMASIVISRLMRELGLPVIAFGCPGKDIEIAQSIEANLKIQGNRSLDGFKIAISKDWQEENWPVRRVLTQVQQCDLVIGPDTGPMWAVSGEEMPKIVLLSHATAENITKYWRNTVALQADQARVPCWPCHRLIDGPEWCVENEWKTGAACISDISADVVVDEARRLFEAHVRKEQALPAKLESADALVIRTQAGNGVDQEMRA